MAQTRPINFDEVDPTPLECEIIHLIIQRGSQTPLNATGNLLRDYGNCVAAMKRLQEIGVLGLGDGKDDYYYDAGPISQFYEWRERNGR
jgi:hypothetical protein